MKNKKSILILLAIFGLNIGLTSSPAQALCFCSTREVEKDFSDTQALPGLRSCAVINGVFTGSCIERYWPRAQSATGACQRKYLDKNPACQN